MTYDFRSQDHTAMKTIPITADSCAKAHRRAYNTVFDELALTGHRDIAIHAGWRASGTDTVCSYWLPSHGRAMRVAAAIAWRLHP